MIKLKTVPNTLAHPADRTTTPPSTAITTTTIMDLENYNNFSTGEY
jgi:hypothetical protein